MTLITRYLNPYKRILQMKIVDGFAAFSKGDYTKLLDLYADNVHQVFEGQHALGGQRHSKAAVELWFQRFIRLLPSQFTLNDIIVSGGPAKTHVTVDFTDFVAPKGIEPYENNGVMLAEVVWGKAVKVHIYVNTQLVVTAIEQLAALGIEEAATPPIED